MQREVDNGGAKWKQVKVLGDVGWEWVVGF